MTTLPIQPVGARAAAMFRRIDRNRHPKLRICPAETPMQSVMGWANERGIRLDAEALGELCSRLRGSRMLFEEDGGLHGSSIVDALREQAKLLQPENWANARLLFSLANRAQGTLDGMGLL